MKLFLLAISIFWITIGLTAVISPLNLKKFYSSMTKLAKKLFILPLLIGTALFWSAPASNLDVFIRVLGIIGLTKGIFLLLCPLNVIASIFNFWLSRPDAFYRFFGSLIILLGIVVGWSVI
jgi:uncharacterized protein YjeT (DUF2065 family)